MPGSVKTYLEVPVALLDRLDDRQVVERHKLDELLHLAAQLGQLLADAAGGAGAGAGAAAAAGLRRAQLQAVQRCLRWGWRECVVEH